MIIVKPTKPVQFYPVTRVYDAAAEFPTGDPTNPNVAPANPGPPWAYGFGVTGIDPMPPFPTVDWSAVLNTQGLAGWAGSNGKNPPVIGKNTTRMAWGDKTSGTVVVPPPNLLYMHPTEDNDAIIEWTAPSSGLYSFGGVFIIADCRPSGVRGKIYCTGGIQVGSDYVLKGPAADYKTAALGGQAPFFFVRFVDKGEKVWFGVNSDGRMSNDSTAFNVQIHKVTNLMMSE